MAALPGVLGDPIKFVLNWGRRYSLWVFTFGLACCAIEFIATSMSRHDFIRLGVIPFAHGPRQADLMVVSGTVTDKMAPAVRRLYDQMAEPKYVISFGACSNCGGPYWDSYSVTKGVDQLIPVDVYIPGCPPRPEALLHGILRLQERIAQEEAGLGGVFRPDPLAGNGRDAPAGRDAAEALAAPLVRPPDPVVPAGVVWARHGRTPVGPAVGADGRMPVTELTVDRAGAGSPYGDDVQFPLPATDLDYQHPTQ
ncbi:MAG TPA: NADH-quinone oxidoreductase subunit B family protein [Kribbellaceae bacterium]|nr:NADH-quinone oxidoreductase subunit B family protein [Kribbellaceae bacterium]